jgi:hypothetical protein
MGVDMGNHADKNFMARVRQSFQLYDTASSVGMTGAAGGATGAARGAEGAATTSVPNEVVLNPQSFQLYDTASSVGVTGAAGGATGAARGAEGAATISVPNEVVLNPLARPQHSAASEDIGVAWSEEWDEVTGHSYWVNVATGESQWMRPAASMLEKSEQKASVWNEVVDEVSGCSYYVNLATGESTWVVPRGYRGALNKGEGNSSENSSSSSSSSDSDSKSSHDSRSGSSSSSDEDDNDYTARRTGGLTKTKNLLGVFAQATKNPMLAGNDELTRVRNMVRSARAAACRTCRHPMCDSVALYGKPSARIAEWCEAHQKRGNILKRRKMDVQERRGDWEELVDRETGRTYYYNPRSDIIRFERPTQWVKMLAQRWENGFKH